MSRSSETGADWTLHETRVRALLQHSTDIITVMAADGKVLYNSPAVQRVLGYPPGELIGQTAFDFVHPDDLELVGARFVEAVTQPGVPVPVDFRFRHRDGRWIPLEAIGVNYLDDPDIGGVIVNSRDLTERQRAERAYRTLVDHSLQGLAILRDQRTVFANQALAEITGYSVEELLALTPEDMRNRLTHPEDEQRVWAMVMADTDEPRRTEFRTVRKDGAVRWLEAFGTQIDYDDGKALLVAYIDITDRRRADEQKAVLLQIAHDLTGTVDRSAIVDRVLGHTRSLLPAQHLFLAHWDAERDAYRPVAGLGDGPVDESLVFPSSHPIIAELHRGQVLVINDVHQQPWLPREMLARHRARALLIAPVIVSDRARAALVAVRADDAAAFSAEEARLLDGIARQLALGLGAAERREREQEDAAISAELAHVARELIAALSRPNLLERLCELTTNALACSRCHTLILDQDAGTFAPTASYGFSREQWEALRAVRFPSALASDILQVLREEDAAAVYAEDESFVAPLLRSAGTPGVLFMPLRRRDEIIGLLAAATHGSEPFSPRQMRIARGIAQLASLSIEDARLVAELERANRLKSEFVATMSHELRTPLNIILGYNSLLLEDAFGPMPPHQRDTLQRVQTNARSLLELINTTLDMSRLEAGQVRVELQHVNLGELLEEIRVETDELQRKDGVRFVWDSPPSLPLLRTDAPKLKVIVKNLLGNAAKFTDHGTIRIGAKPSDAGIDLYVSDTGIGIDSEAQAIIFDAFRQADSALTRRHGGVGLGLYIVRRLTTELGGTVEVESTPGQGSTFSVHLPAG